MPHSYTFHSSCRIAGNACFASSPWQPCSTMSTLHVAAMTVTMMTSQLTTVITMATEQPLKLPVRGSYTESFYVLSHALVFLKKRILILSD